LRDLLAGRDLTNRDEAVIINRFHCLTVFQRQNKSFYFFFEALGSLSCGFYGNYVFFLFRDCYGFGNIGNLGIAALQGSIWAVASWQGGRFAQRLGYFTALRAGLIGMATALLFGVWLQTLVGQVAALVIWTASTCYMWPALEALVSDGETDLKLPKQLGKYNVVWASCSAFSYFFGGAVFEHLGYRSIYWLPVVVYVMQFGMLVRFTSQNPVSPRVVGLSETHYREPEAVAFRRLVSPRMFLKMAWFANPFACIGINTLLATIPALAHDLNLSTTASGLFCSVWFFARLASFIFLWQWRGWHYRFRWLIGAFLGLIGGLCGLLVVRNCWLLFVAQILFGFSVGFIYFSSIFYSMDVGETKGVHGGIHEAAMGIGNCIGPALGATTLMIAPHSPNAGAYAVSGFLAVGLLGLICLGFSSRGSPISISAILQKLRL
jgi:MFS family permease